MRRLVGTSPTQRHLDGAVLRGVSPEMDPENQRPKGREDAPLEIFQEHGGAGWGCLEHRPKRAVDRVQKGPNHREVAGACLDLRILMRLNRLPRRQYLRAPRYAGDRIVPRRLSNHSQPAKRRQGAGLDLQVEEGLACALYRLAQRPHHMVSHRNACEQPGAAQAQSDRRYIGSQ